MGWRHCTDKDHRDRQTEAGHQATRLKQVGPPLVPVEITKQHTSPASLPQVFGGDADVSLHMCTAQSTRAPGIGGEGAVQKVPAGSDRAAAGPGWRAQPQLLRGSSRLRAQAMLRPSAASLWAMWGYRCCACTTPRLLNVCCFEVGHSGAEPECATLGKVPVWLGRSRAVLQQPRQVMVQLARLLLLTRHSRLAV